MEANQKFNKNKSLTTTQPSLQKPPSFQITCATLRFSSKALNDVASMSLFIDITEFC